LGDSPITFTWADLILLVLVGAVMLGLTLLVKFTRLGKAMRATAQNPTAAQLMGIHVERVIGATFAIGGGLAGFAAVIYATYIGTVAFQITGYTNGLYAFTAAVLGGIGNIPGAVLGGFVIGMVRAMSAGYLGERWSPAIIFGILILILVFRPAGLLGARTRDKV
jgi:branched-chain amino acid transport system permease protein